MLRTLCSRCKQPMVASDNRKSAIRAGIAYSGELCLDCKEAHAHTPAADRDCWEYMKRGTRARMRDAHYSYGWGVES